MGNIVELGERVENQINFLDVRMIQKTDDAGKDICTHDNFDDCINDVQEYHMMKVRAFEI